MATDVEINTIINNAGSAEGLKDLRKSLKELISLQGQVGVGSEHFKKLQKAINDTEGKLGDLNDSFQTLRGSGVERLNSSIALLREGFNSADPGKLKIAFEGLGAAIKAVPIFLIIEGIKFLFDNFGKLVDVVKELSGGFSEEEKKVKSLTIAYEKQVLQSIRLTAELDAEIALLKAKKAPLTEILELETKRFDLKEKDLKLQLELAKATLEQSKSEKTLAGSIADNFGVYGVLFDLFSGNAQERVVKSKKTEKEIAEIESAITRTQSDEEVNRLNTLRQIEEQARAEREKRVLAFLEFIKGKNQQEIELEQDRISIENRLHQEEIDKAIEQIEAERKIRRLFAEQDKDAQEQADKDLKVKSQNQLAFQNAFIQKSLEDKIDAAKKERDALLLNESLTQQERIKIIEDSENKIFQIKVKAAQQNIQYAQQVAQITNSLNQLVTQGENYELQQRQYTKDAAVQNDQNRTQEELDREELRKNTLLNNASLTASQREKIAYESETRQRQISEAGKSSQNQLNEEFARKELSIKKEQFERNKKLQIATGLVNTAAAVLQTLASVPYPANIPLALLAGAAGLAQVGIIASQEFDDGGAASKASVPAVQSIDTRGGLSSSNPVSRDPGSLIPKTFDPDGTATKKQGRASSNTTRVVMVESDYRETADRIDVLEARRTFAE